MMYGLSQFNLKSARELMLEANFSHDSMMAHLKAIYEERQAACVTMIMIRGGGVTQMKMTNSYLLRRYEEYFESLQPGEEALTIREFAEALGFTVDDE